MVEVPGDIIVSFCIRGLTVGALVIILVDYDNTLLTNCDVKVQIYNIIYDKSTVISTACQPHVSWVTSVACNFSDVLCFS